jgi:hypothetical protein
MALKLCHSFSGIHPMREEPVAGSCGHSDESLGSVKGGEYLSS